MSTVIQTQAKQSWLSWIAMLFISMLVVSNVVAEKLVSFQLFGLNIIFTSGLFIFPLTYLIDNVLTEVYGFQVSRRIIWGGMIINALCVILISITIYVPPAPIWHDQEAFSTVLGGTPRIFIASVTAYLLGEYVNSQMLSRLKIAWQGKRLGLRCIFSTALGALIDCILFGVIAFSGVLDWSTLIGFIAFQYIFKLTYEIIMVPVTAAFIRKVKQYEGMDVFDTRVKYRLFSLETDAQKVDNQWEVETRA